MNLNFNFLLLFFIIIVGVRAAKCDKYHSRFLGSRLNDINETIVYQQKKAVIDVLKIVVLKYYKNGTKYAEKSMFDDDDPLKYTNCTAQDKFAIILHGWIQSCNDGWVVRLVDRLSYHRGGCIICFDYSTMSMSTYAQLYINFRLLVEAIKIMLSTLIKAGIDMNQAYMFGFSFGGQLASAVGRSLSSSYAFANIDTCDMAGPGFDGYKIDHRTAAKHVQCFHSSQDKGTGLYLCHRNILLGNCGYNQPAVASQAHLGSHGLCLDIYINSFDYPFYALMEAPTECKNTDWAKHIPNGYTIGYEEHYNSKITGRLFVPTNLNYPYNLSKKELYFKQFKLN